MENKEEIKQEKKSFLKKIGAFLDNHQALYEIIRFVIIGGLATVIDMLFMGITPYIFQPENYPSFFNVFYGATATPSGVSTIVGTAVGFIIGLIFNYIFSIVFVFKTKGKSKSTKGFFLFAFLSAIGLGIHILGMWLGFDLLGINEWIVKIVLTCVVLVYNYITRKTFIFKDKKVDLEEKEITNEG